MGGNLNQPIKPTVCLLPQIQVTFAKLDRNGKVTGLAEMVSFLGS